MAPETPPTRHRRSIELFGRAQSSLPGGNSRTTVFREPHPIYAERGSGCRVADVDGVERIDFYNNATALLHGHAHPVIVDAVTRQLRQGSAFAHPTTAEIALAELLCERVVSFERVRFCNSGTEAVMIAIQAARAFTGRTAIAKCEGAYHGGYEYAEVSLDSAPHNWGPADRPSAVPYAASTPPAVLRDVVVLPFNDVAATRALLDERADEIAAVLVDPLPLRIGLVPATAEYLSELVDFARRSGALLVFDEVVSFRSGHGGAQTAYGIRPDLTALGKIVGGGFPVGALAGRADVMDVFSPIVRRPAVPHAGTFNANPVTMVAGHAGLTMFTPDEIERLDGMGRYLREGMQRVIGHLGIPVRVNGVGSLARLHFADAPVTSYRDAYVARQRSAPLMDHLYELMLDRGVLMSPEGLFALSTPMRHEELDICLNALEGSLAVLELPVRT